MGLDGVGGVATVTQRIGSGLVELSDAVGRENGEWVALRSPNGAEGVRGGVGECEGGGRVRVGWRKGSAKTYRGALEMRLEDRNVVGENRLAGVEGDVDEG